MILGRTKVDVVFSTHSNEDERVQAELLTLVIQRNNRIALRLKIEKEGQEKMELTLEPDQCIEFIQLLKQVEFASESPLYND